MTSVAWVLLLGAVAAQDQTSAGQRAVALHRVLFSGELDPPRLPAQLEAMTELALAYQNGLGVAADIDLACSFAFLAAAEIARTMPGTPLDARASDVRGRACSEVRDTAISMLMIGCPTFGVSRHTFVIGPSTEVTFDRAGIRIDTPVGRQLHPPVLTCGEIVMGVRHTRVSPPASTGLEPRDFLQLTSWVATIVHSGGPPSRTLTWRLIELHPSGAEPTRHEHIDVLIEPEWAWPTPSVPETLSEGATLRMSNTGQVLWSFDRAPELGTGVIEPLKP